MSWFPIMPALRSAINISDYFSQVAAHGAVTLVVRIPSRMIVPHERQAQKNHGQSLARLAERGGLSASEAVAVIEGHDYRFILEGEAHRQLGILLAKYCSENPLQ